MFKNLIIIGAGGHGQAVADLAISLDKFEKISFLDDSYPENVAALGFPIVGKSIDLFKNKVDFDACFVAIGNNEARKKLIDKIIESELPLVSLIHPKAWVSSFASIGAGCAIMAGAVVSTNAKLGVGVLINANATVDHDCILGDFSHLGVGGQLAGGVMIGNCALLKTGCTVGCGVKVNPKEVFSAGMCLE